MMFELVVVGGGNMGAALLGGMLDAGVVAPCDVAVVEAYAPRRGELTGRFGGVSIVDAVPSCAAAVLAVKPPDIAAVAAEVAARGARRVLSVAAGVTTASIVAAVGADVAVLRTMPNTPALVRQGVSALSGAPGTSGADLDWAEQILSGVGLVVRVAESQLD
ncbi:MAG: NAD(P)-binding domain-containing protein, partial [Ilumatobacter sp.]